MVLRSRTGGHAEHRVGFIYSVHIVYLWATVSHLFYFGWAFEASFIVATVVVVIIIVSLLLLLIPAFAEEFWRGWMGL